jgi:hypothetical protein
LDGSAISRTGDQSDSTAISWQVKKATPYVPSPLLLGGSLYVYSADNAIVSCYRATTGKANFVEQPLEGMGEILHRRLESPIGSVLSVVMAQCRLSKTPMNPRFLATNKLDEKFNASPAIVGNELFLKGKGNLYCIAKPS